MEFVKFWLQCVIAGWRVGDGFFAFLEIVTFLVSGILRGRRKLTKHVAPWENFAMIWTFRIFWISFAISTVFVAPFLSNRDTSRQLVSATNELASMGPVVPFELYSNQLADANMKMGSFSNSAVVYYQRWIEALAATNSSATPAMLQTAIDIVRGEQLIDTNSESLKTILQQQRDLDILQRKKNSESQITGLQPVYPIWKYAFSTLEETLAQASKKCTNNYIIKTFPGIDSISAHNGTTLDLGSGCGWGCSCLINYSPENILRINWTGTKSKSCVTDFIYHQGEGIFYVFLRIPGEPDIGRQCQMSDTPECINNVDFILGLLKQEQAGDIQ